MAIEAVLGATGAAVVDAVDSVASAVTGLPACKTWLQGCKTRLVAGRVSPRNHDLIKGIRTAHLSHWIAALQP